MSCPEVNPCNPCNPDYSDTGCPDYPKTGCVIYDGDDIPCLSITKTENLNDVLEHIKDTLCALTPTAYADFDFGCFSTVGITTEQEFAEFISSILCQILGTQEDGSITSLSSLYSSIQSLITNLNLVKSQTLISCFQTISGLTSPQDISILLTAIQTILCDHEDRIVALEGGSGGTSIVANDSNTIDFTTSGTLDHTITAAVKLSATANNAITSTGTGIHCLSPVITPTDTDEINLSVSGVHSHTLQANLNISALSGNILSIEADGLFAKPAGIQATDSTTINFTVINDNTFTGVVTIDPDVNNILVATGNGLFVNGSGFALSNNSVTDAILRDSTSYSVIGRATGSVGDPADIVATSDTVLRRSGTGNLAFGTLVTNNIGAGQITYSRIQNMSSGKLLGRSTGGSGSVEEITVSTGLTLSGGILTSNWSSQVVESTYTPVLTNSTNVADSTAYETYYTQVGNTVKVWGEVDIDATLALTLSELTMSIPVLSVISSTYDIAGTGACSDNTVVRISGIVASDTVKFSFTPQTNSNNKYSFLFVYTITPP